MPDKDDREKQDVRAGKGWRDEVGRSGVYPMSGPHPEGPAEIRTEASWGQGDRGAAGYKDHGSSELTYEEVHLLGGLEEDESAEVLEGEVPRCPARVHPRSARAAVNPCTEGGIPPCRSLLAL